MPTPHEIVAQIARMTPYKFDLSDDKLEDAVVTINNLIAAAKAATSARTIAVHVRGGMVEQIEHIPHGVTIDVHDHDSQSIETHSAEGR